METPVLRKVQGKMAEVLRKESWPGPEKGNSWRNERRMRNLLRGAVKDVGTVDMQAEKPS